MTSKIPSISKRYADRAEDGDLVVEISFTGGNELGKGNPELTDVRLRLLKKEADREHQVWTRDLGNVPMPTGAWHDFDLVQCVAGKIYAGVSNSLRRFNLADGAAEWTIEIGNTALVQVIPSSRRDMLIVCNTYSEYEHPKGLANLAAFSLEGNEVWRVACNGEVFIGNARFEDGVLLSNTFSCWEYQIDERTGKVLAKTFTK